MRDSRFGRALVVECRPGAGGYLLGFKIDDTAARERTQTEVLTLHSAWYERPDFGIKFDVETDGGEDSGAGTGAAGPAPKARVMDDVQIVEDGEEEGKNGEGAGGGGGHDVVAAYFAEGAEEGEGEREVVFSQLLGLAVEAPPAGLSLERLWAVS
jgi:Bardet-Biedl syndrome 5 protein